MCPSSSKAQFIEGLREIAEKNALGDAAIQSLEHLVHQKWPGESSIYGQDTLVISQEDQGDVDLEQTIDLPQVRGTYWPATGQTTAAQTQIPERMPNHYEDLGLIGRGGLGEVRRVQDRNLNRVMVMKVLRPELMDRHRSSDRFIEEAQLTAQLQHPGIVPVHELGRLADGRVYFTMKEVRGQTLDTVLQDVHSASDGAKWRPGARTGWTFRRLIEAFRRVCDAVAYAHNRRVIHRDLKPTNIMVGQFGEVLVVDWGLASVLSPDALGGTSRDGDSPPITDGPHLGSPSWVGTIAGTPAYMSPEQARGDVTSIGTHSDVYSLGALLHELLVGQPLISGGDTQKLLKRVAAGPPPLKNAPNKVPDELWQICKQAISRDPSERYLDAEALSRAVARWIEGSEAEQYALTIARSAQRWQPEIDALRDQMVEAAQRAESHLEGVKLYEPVEQKIAGWSLQDKAEALQLEMELRQLNYVQGLRSALNHSPDLPLAHSLLAEFYQKQHSASEASGDLRRAAHLDVLLRDHDRGRFAAYLRGDGAVSLISEPSGAMVRLWKYVESDRRLRLSDCGYIGQTPLVHHPLPMGSYVLDIEAPGYQTVRYPVFIERQQHWMGVAPGESEPTPIVLPKLGELGPEDVYVPPGWYLSGGDEEAYGAGPRRKVWVDAYVMRKFPITNEAYKSFLDDLAGSGQAEQAARFVPRERPGTLGEQGAAIYGQKDDGGFVLREDSDGDLWQPDWPVVMVDWHCATAYANWYAQQQGQGWQLPADVQWEKAARGVDGRFFPWGNFIDPTFANVRDSHPGQSRMVSVDAFPVDEGPYGVRGLAGNVLDWCRDVYVRGQRSEGFPIEGDGSAELRLCRGGSLACRLQSARVSKRDGCNPLNRDYDLGFRLVRPFQPSEKPDARQGKLV